MNVDIQGLEFTLTEALSDHARRRLRFVMTRFERRIERIQVRLVSHPSRLTGLDKFCRIQVHLLNAPVAVTHESGSDFYDVTDRAIDRVGRVVVRHLDQSAMFGVPGQINAKGASLDGFSSARHRDKSEGAQI